MNVEFTKLAWEDYCFWNENDNNIILKINELIKVIQRDSFKGIGKPEPLKFGLKGCWSRRISGEHRLVYKVVGEKGKDQKCIILQCRFHYDE